MASSLTDPQSDTTTPVSELGGRPVEFVDLLLDQQQQLTAVEQFSNDHDRGAIGVGDEPDQARFYKSLLPATAPSEDQQFAFEVDLDACSGCKACVVACHSLNGLEETESWRKVGTVTLGNAGNTALPIVDSSLETESLPGIQHVTTACHHCEDPGCLNGCPVKAYDKDPITGIVRHLDDQCIGCKYCTMMCPYEVPKYSKRLGIVRKCDMCHNRLAVGEAPACVQSCPNEAIKIRLVDRRQPTELIDHSVALAPGAPPSHITRPTTVYKSRHADNLSLPQDHGIDEVAESHWPLAALLVATQISVGMLVAERLGATAAWLAGTPLPSQVTATVAFIALVVGFIGLNLAPLHLGQPLRSWRIFLGLRTSWLSREAVVLGNYVLALVSAVALLSLPLLVDWVPQAVTDFVSDNIPSWAGMASYWSSIAIGLVGLYCSAMIYIATQRPIWRYRRTMLRFGATTIVGGLAFGAAVIAIAGRISNLSVETPVVLLAFAATFTLAAKLVWEWQTHLGPGQETDSSLENRCRRLTKTSLSELRSIRLLAGAIGIVALLSLTLLPSSIVLAVVVAAAVIGGEYIERLLYFSSVVYDRMPGTLR